MRRRPKLAFSMNFKLPPHRRQHWLQLSVKIVNYLRENITNILYEENISYSQRTGRQEVSLVTGRKVSHWGQWRIVGENYWSVEWETHLTT